MEAMFVVTILIVMGIGIVATILGIFLFSHSNWWDKLL